MSEPDGAEIGRRIGDHSADIIADRGGLLRRRRYCPTPDFARHQGEIGHRGRQIQLEFRLDPTEVAGLPGWLDAAPICAPLPPVALDTRVVGALLQGPGLLPPSWGWTAPVDPMHWERSDIPHICLQR